MTIQTMDGREVKRGTRGFEVARREDRKSFDSFASVMIGLRSCSTVQPVFDGGAFSSGLGAQRCRLRCADQQSIRKLARRSKEPSVSEAAALES